MVIRREGGAGMRMSQVMARVSAMASAIALIAACSPSAAPTDTAAPVDATAIAEAIKADVRQTVAAFNARDAEAAVRSNAPDFIQMFHGEPNADSANNLANTRQQVSDPVLDLTIADDETAVAQGGDMVFYSNRYTYTFTDPATNAPRKERGNWVLIYRRQSDETMKVFREIISDLPPE